MLYRVQPGSELMWSDTDASLVDLAREGIDLDLLEWRPVQSEHRHADVVALALRHGTKTGTGIVFAAQLLSESERPQKLMQDYENLRKASGDPAIQAADARREQVSPGWIEAGKKSDQVVWESVRAAVLDAEKRAAELMSRPVREDLVAWWQNQGGIIA
ncbi:hypothetical protein [Citricoccus sp.]|uniref:hypothetical protein n=1 Tax=Citricoccus sp. TaxID=1978372 RepID=UPI00260DA34F|nr:hypothetical protein [Citricoccus sp.]HRO94822.1 hypothetical protein [Citricoccus sp.]